MPDSLSADSRRPQGTPYDDADVDAALIPDMQGIGSGPDVMSHPPGPAAPGTARATALLG